MIELVRAKLTHTYADARGLCYGDAFNFSDLLEPPEEERGIGFPQNYVILADCTTTIETAGKWWKCESYIGASTPWLAAWAGHELGGSAPHQCS